jgi:hypothetical protein
MFVVEARSLA